MKKSLKETELYPYIKNFFENKGYFVKGEVKNCDIACILKNELTIIEIKKSFTLKLIYQALERKNIADFVFVAIPQPKNFRKKEVKHMLKILKSLEIGLITIELESHLKPVQIIYSPIRNKVSSSNKRKTILNELKKSTLDFNLGGSSSKDFIITLYRENCIQIACLLKVLEKSSPKNLLELGCSKNTGQILRNNYYNWFEKVSRGIYKLSKEGENIFLEDKYKNVIKYYEMEIEKNVKTGKK